jgi:RNA polymerase sigma-70 factor (ECF subfamily)
MSLSHDQIMRVLFGARSRLSAAAWVIARDAQAAEDIFQNVALKALAETLSFEHDGALLSWATVCARREAMDWLRRRQPEVATLDADLLDLLEAEALQDAARAEPGRWAALEECLQALPSEARQLLEWRYFDGRSCAEVATAAGMNLDAVYQRLSRLHRQLRACIERRLAAATPEAHP